MAEGTTRGTVRSWSHGNGWGVIDSADTPGGCWAHFSHLTMPGYKSLQARDEVMFRFESAEQDGFSFRTVKVWPADETEPPDSEPDVRGPSAAYDSTLRIRRTDGDAEDVPGT